MPLNDAYSWVKFVHVLAVLGFLAAHGASVSVAFKLRGERERDRISAVLDFSWAYLKAMYGSLLALRGRSPLLASEASRSWRS